jgi:cellobiose dehydrogenase (acceptor)
MLSSLWLVAALGAMAYGQVGSSYTEPNTGIKFWDVNMGASAGTNGMKMGFALPATTQTTYQDEYIGHMVGGLSATGGWAGLSHSSGMTGALLLTFWPNSKAVQGSFRYAT